MSIPDYKIDEVREATDVVDLISGYVTLKKKGQNFFGLCPFHPEKTPSFSVNSDKQIFHCFGCGAGGNVFTFLMRSEEINFPESIKSLARRAGIQIEYDEKDEARSQENESLYYLNEFAAKFFQESLLSKKGEHAFNYLKDRGLSSEDIEAFGLGYAPPGWQGLITQAKNTSNDLELLHRAGLTLKKEEGGYYDRFRDRIMFPILNLSGRAVAFGGRKLSENDDSPKYINSPETSVYEKGKMLYGLFQNRDEIRKQKKSVFVEGYMDLLSLVANDIKNVVASLGTSLTEEQSRLILRYSKHAVLMYDSDSAGIAAALRGADILLETGLDAFVVRLPKGHDPDSYVLENGTEALLKKIENADNLFDYKVQHSLDKPPENRREEVRSILESIARIKDAIQRSLIITKVSEQLNVSEKALWSDLAPILQQKQKGERRQSEISKRLNDLGKTRKSGRGEKAVADLIRIMIHDWNLAEYVFANLDLTELKDLDLFPIVNYLKNQQNGGGRPSEKELNRQFNDVELTAFIVQVFNEDWEELNLKRWATDCISVIHKEKIQKQIEIIREEIRLAQDSGQPVNDLLHQCMELEVQKKTLSAEI